MYTLGHQLTDLSLSDIMTRTAFLNAITITNILGGSTNAVLHLLAIARSAEVPLTVDDFQTIRARTPYLANLKPSGQYVMEDLHKAGGVPSLLKYIMTHPEERVRNLIDFDVMTVTSKTWRENLKDVEPLKFGEGDQDVIRPFERPLKETGHLTILRGNLCPGSAVAKLTGKEGLKFEVRHLYKQDVRVPLLTIVWPSLGYRKVLRHVRFPFDPSLWN